jgi:cytochrome c oxidase subunit 2
MVIPGQVATVTTEFEEPTSYGIVCHEYCGSGHHTMEGQVRVVPQSEYNGTEGSA